METKRTIGYICPACGRPVLGERTAFALTASVAAVICDCGKGRFLSEPTETGARLTVPCGLCGKEHRAEVDQKALLQGPGIALSCPETGRLCCYIGPEEAVTARMEELAIAQEKEKRAEQEETAFLDSIIMYEVLSEVKEIAQRGGISCGCGSHDYQIAIRRTAVDLTCAACGTVLRLPATTDEDLDSLCCRYTLQIPGKKP